MSRHQSLQAPDAPREQIARSHHAAHRPHQGHWISVKQLAVDLDFTTTAPGNPEDACRQWLRRNQIVGVRRGRVILVDSLDVDRALRGR